MTETFCYVTTACRVSDDIFLPPDGGELWCGTILGSVGQTLQQVFQRLCEDLPQRHRYCEGQRPRRQISQPYHKYGKLASEIADIRSGSQTISLLQPEVETCWLKNKQAKSTEQDALPILREHDGTGLQLVRVCSAEGSLHHLQLERGAASAASHHQGGECQDARLPQLPEGHEVCLRHRRAQQQGGRGGGRRAARRSAPAPSRPRQASSHSGRQASPHQIQGKEQVPQVQRL